MNLQFTINARLGFITLSFGIGLGGFHAFIYILNAKKIDTVRVASCSGIILMRPGWTLDGTQFDNPKPWCFAWGIHFAEGGEYPHIWKIC